jgi:hypothetical protein
MRMALAMVLVLDLAATATLASLHGTRTLRKGFGLRRERPSSYAHRHAQSQHKRRDQQSYALPHLLTPFAYSRRDGPAYSCLRGVYVLQRTKEALNFGELRQCELRRIPIPRTWVNKGKEKGRGCSKLRPPNG